LAPLAKSSTPFTVVGTSTWITSPRRGALVTVRVELPIEACAPTRATGPSRLISCVT
jgi:hypothetical protein